jgi:hypothetical protein
MLAVTLNSCDKDEVMPTPESLNGTTWEAEPTSQIVNGKTVTGRLSLAFSSKTVVFNLNMKIDGVTASSPATYDYSYSKPLVSISATASTDPASEASKLNGAVDGNGMTLGQAGGETYVLIRKQ